MNCHVYCVSNDDKVLGTNLLSSPDIASGAVEVTIFRDERNASAPYNKAIEQADADILVFAHHDIYFPRGWFGHMLKECERLSVSDPAWAVAGSFGVTEDGHKLVGHVWDTTLGFVCGGAFVGPKKAVSLDEVVLIVRRSSGMRFDPRLPGFHLYGTDIVLEARSKRKSAYILNLPMLHNSGPKPASMFADYKTPYRYMTRKWRPILPWPTVILTLTANPLHLWISSWRRRYAVLFRRLKQYPRLANPEQKARELGFVLDI